MFLSLPNKKIEWNLQKIEIKNKNECVNESYDCQACQHEFKKKNWKQMNSICGLNTKINILKLKIRHTVFWLPIFLLLVIIIMIMYDVDDVCKCNERCNVPSQRLYSNIVVYSRVCTNQICLGYLNGTRAKILRRKRLRWARK